MSESDYEALAAINWSTLKHMAVSPQWWRLMMWNWGCCQMCGNPFAGCRCYSKAVRWCRSCLIADERARRIGISRDVIERASGGDRG